MRLALAGCAPRSSSWTRPARDGTPELVAGQFLVRLFAQSENVGFSAATTWPWPARGRHLLLLNPDTSSTTTRCPRWSLIWTRTQRWASPGRVLNADGTTSPRAAAFPRR